jgi:hypothetical protein
MKKDNTMHENNTHGSLSGAQTDVTKGEGGIPDDSCFELRVLFGTDTGHALFAECQYKGSPKQTNPTINNPINP